MAVKENREVEGQQMERCNSLSTQKSMERSCKLRKRFELKPRGSVKWLISKHPKDGIASLADDTTNGKSKNVNVV